MNTQSVISHRLYVAALAGESRFGIGTPPPPIPIPQSGSYVVVEPVRWAATPLAEKRRAEAVVPMRHRDARVLAAGNGISHSVHPANPV